MTSNLSPAAQAAQDEARDKGRFGEQGHADPGTNIGLPVAMTEDAFHEQFKPMQSPEDSTVWEFEQVQAAGIPDNQVWTVTEGDNETLSVSPGYAVVDQIGYMVTEVPRTDADAGVTVTLDGPELPLLTDLVTAEVAERLREQPTFMQGEDMTHCDQCGSRTEEQDIRGEEEEGLQLHTCLGCKHQFLACWPGEDDCQVCGFPLNDARICMSCDGECPDCGAQKNDDGTCLDEGCHDDEDSEDDEEDEDDE